MRNASVDAALAGFVLSAGCNLVLMFILTGHSSPSAIHGIESAVAALSAHHQMAHRHLSQPSTAADASAGDDSSSSGGRDGDKLKLMLPPSISPPGVSSAGAGYAIDFSVLASPTLPPRSSFLPPEPQQA